MAKMWEGRNTAQTNAAADAFNSSIGFDYRMYADDIRGSIAHATMLARAGIITDAERDAIIDGLEKILADIQSGALALDFEAEDIHMFVESELTARIGEAGKKVHTARSRNDQVALDVRLYLLREVDMIQEQLRDLIVALADKAEANFDTIMPGYTHLQRAQPITFGHHIMAYAWMFDRDYERLLDAKKRIAVSPIGSCALAGTTYPTDRAYEAALLGLDYIAQNSLDGVSDRDFVIEFLSAASLAMMHLSRLSEELVMWSSWEFGYITISDEYTTGSSIMPQKKNPDMAELIRGKTGRVYGDLLGLLTVMKGLPLAYNKDMQEDKEALFDAVDTLKSCLNVMTLMIPGIEVHPEKMKAAAAEGFINATDLADYLTKKGVPFRTSYKISGEIVGECIARHLTLETLPLSDYQRHSEVFDEDLFEAIAMDTCVKRRNSDGGTSPENVLKQISAIRAKYLIAEH